MPVSLACTSRSSALLCKPASVTVIGQQISPSATAKLLSSQHGSRLTRALVQTGRHQRLSTATGSSPAAGKNHVYPPIRNPDSFYTYLSHSTSSRTPLLTLWTASWCPTCRTVSPILRALVESGAGEAEGGVCLAEVEFDSPDMAAADPSLALTYMINSIPTLLSFDAGEAQTDTRVTNGRQLADREFLKAWIVEEAKRHGGRGGGGGGGAAFGGLFARWK